MCHTPPFVGLVHHSTNLDWADRRLTSQCYLRAWTHASRQADRAAPSNLGVDGHTGAVAALHKEFIPNWTSEEFCGFVAKLASVTDAWAAKAGDKEHGECERLWVRVLELEAKFWPDV